MTTSYQDILQSYRNAGEEAGLRTGQLIQQDGRTPAEEAEMWDHLGSMHFRWNDIQQERYNWGSGFRYGLYRSGLLAPHSFAGVFANHHYNPDFLAEFKPRQPGPRTHREMIEQAKAAGATHVYYSGFFYGAFYRPDEKRAFSGISHFSFDHEWGWWEVHLDTWSWNYGDPTGDPRLVEIDQAQDHWMRGTRGRYGE